MDDLSEKKVHCYLSLTFFHIIADIVEALDEWDMLSNSTAVSEAPGWPQTFWSLLRPSGSGHNSR